MDFFLALQKVFFFVFFVTVLCSLNFISQCLFQSFPIAFFFLLCLMQEKPEIRDKDDAKPLKLDGGSIQFDNVHFR
jgi:hypothetical protein